MIQLLLALQFGGNQFAWSSSQIIGLFCGAGVTFIIWLVWNNHKGDEALLPFSIIKRRVVWISGVNYTFLMATLFGASYFLPIYFQAVKGVNAILSGVYLLATVLPQLTSVVLSGFLGKLLSYTIFSLLRVELVTKVGFIPPFALFGAALASISSGLFALLQPNTTTGQWIGYQVLNGFGRGVGFQMVSCPLTAT